MKWIRDTEHRYLYSLEWSKAGYTFLLTDLQTVYEERLSNELISSRGDQLNSAFALNCSDQISAFLTAVHTNLQSHTGVILQVPEQVLVETEEADIQLKWAFKLHKADTNTAFSIFASIISNLFSVVENMGVALTQSNAVINDKNRVLSGVHEALQRRLDYRPPKHLERAYSDRDNIPQRTSDDPVELAGIYWPAVPNKTFLLPIKETKEEPKDDEAGLQHLPEINDDPEEKPGAVDTKPFKAEIPNAAATEPAAQSLRSSTTRGEETQEDYVDNDTDSDVTRDTFID